MGETTTRPGKATPSAATSSVFRIREARFLRSAPTMEALGAAEAPEVAFLGRSNVGKSSLLGILLDRPKLVRVSKEPGRTRDINLFGLDVLRVENGETEVKSICLVDLPGYGYAKVSKSEKDRMGRLISSFLMHRTSLVAACQLFDVRHVPSSDDQLLYQDLCGASFQHVKVATKCDKLPVSKRKGGKMQLAKRLECDARDIVLFSSSARLGRDDLWRRIWSSLP